MYPPPSLLDFQARPTPPTGQKNYLASVGNIGPQTPLWEAFLPPKEDDPASPIVEYGLSLEELNERVVAPLKGSHDVRLDGRTIPFGGMERIEIRAEGTDLKGPPVPNRLLDLLRNFDWSGTDVTKEFTKDPRRGDQRSVRLNGRKRFPWIYCLTGWLRMNSSVRRPVIASIAATSLMPWSLHSSAWTTLSEQNPGYRTKVDQT